MPREKATSTIKRAGKGDRGNLSVLGRARIFKGRGKQTQGPSKSRGQSSIARKLPKPRRHSKNKPTTYLEEPTHKNTERASGALVCISDEPNCHVAPEVENPAIQKSKKRPAPPAEEIPAKRLKPSTTAAPLVGTKPRPGPLKLIEWLSKDGLIPRNPTSTVLSGPSLHESRQQTPPALEQSPLNRSNLPPLGAILAEPSKGIRGQSPPTPQKQTSEPTVPAPQILDTVNPSMLTQSLAPPRRGVPSSYQSGRHPDTPKFLFRAFHSESGSKYTLTDGFKTNHSRGLDLKNWEVMRDSLDKHFNLNNRESTHWISTTADLLRALCLACKWEHLGKKGVCIAIISTETSLFTKVEVYSAKGMSLEHNIEKAELRKTEWLFYSHVPSGAVKVCLPLQKLQDSGLGKIVPALNVYCKHWKRRPVDVEYIREMIKAYKLPGKKSEIWTNEGLTAGKIALLFRGGKRKERDKYIWCIARQALKWRQRRVYLGDWEEGYIDDALERILGSDR